MARAEMDIEKQGYSGFERFMFFVTPILFTIVLLGVLLTLFNFDLRNKMLSVGNSIPFLDQVLPDPESENVNIDENKVQSENTSAKIAELNAQLAEKESALKVTADAKTKLEQQINDLQNQVAQLGKANDAQKFDDEQYQAKISDLASMYTKIAPSKAAPILEVMEPEEAVLVLNSMRADDRAKILEKMTPKTAADLTVRLKDATSAKDLQIAALQARIRKQQSSSNEPTSTLNATQLKETFSNMTASSAAELLIKMSEVSPSKVLRILNAVDSTTRSSILSEMSKLNEGVTAQLVSKLMSGK